MILKYDLIPKYLPRRLLTKMISISDIEKAAVRINGKIHKTPVLRNKTVDEIAGREFYFKAEHLQKTGSFKSRGALNAVSCLADSVENVCCDSSGNHGQALAWAASVKGKVCHVAVPEGAPVVKINAMNHFGAKVHYCPPHDVGRKEKCEELISKFNCVMVHPNQDAQVIAGQGTIGLEIVSQISDLDVLVIPVGGGGLISGIATVIKSIWPNTKIVAAEPDAVDDCRISFEKNERIVTEKKFTVCDGVRTNIGPNTWPMIKSLVDNVITVTDTEVAKAWVLMMERMKCVIEPTGALALAVAMSEEFNKLYPAESNKKVGIIICGGNLDLSAVQKMIELSNS